MAVGQNKVNVALELSKIWKINRIITPTKERQRIIFYF
ncbi:Hypothetical protein I595_797 [Croceitalea dokdonensis DOKDO 023]|uniref:Uncharacterized protein n=1 Tax=Croceitalea dokdonensis DOKDO 023 TaxID=1300341 RepID=A0A0P7AKL2_9FLAO|nr:Hypothetical protein I595_797 [Croceitalea dokdonensis DOKDO 023]